MLAITTQLNTNWSNPEKMRAVIFRTVLASVLCLFSYSALAQDYRLEGRVINTETEEPVWNANVFVQETQQGTTTGEDGTFELLLPAGQYTIRFSFIGYREKIVEVELNQNKDIEVEMLPEGLDVDEVEIEGKRERSLERTEMGEVELEMREVERLPVVFGEIDILKTLELTPGVQSGTEGTSSLNVRGGGPEQNLILLDGAPLYNPDHLLGFFSVFHPDAIQDFSLNKGDMPARYGGRISSVLDVNLKPGDEEEFNARGGLGLISSRAMVEGPIREGRGGFMVAGRRTYADLVAQPFLDDDLQGSRAYFYDLTGRAHYRLNSENTLSLSGYIGRDDFSLEGGGADGASLDFNIDWGNTAGNLNWRRNISSNLFADYSLYYTNYDFSFNTGLGQLDFQLLSEVRDIGGRAEFQYFPTDRNQILFGAEFVNHRVEPGIGRVDVEDETEFEPNINERRANHYSFFAQDQWDINDRLRLSYGLRYSLFQQVGPYERLARNDQGIIEDTSSFDSWEEVALYDGLEPRLAGRYLLTDNTSLKASATRNYQYMHLASATNGTLPTDVWVPSSELVEPQRSDQIAAGIEHDFTELGFEVGVESYYRWLDGQADFEPGADLVLNNFIDEEFLQGKGTAYGLEVLLERRLDDWGGWLSYTWANTDRTIDGINDGEPFSPQFDVTHELSLTASYEFNEYWNASFIFVYATGQPFTPELGAFAGDFGLAGGASNFPIFADERNSFRAEDYHRADISVNYQPGGDPQPGEFNSSWNFSIYNLYNRANPYFYNFNQNALFGESTSEKVYVFPIIPSVTYNFRF